MRIYLVRHGETELNQKKCYYGHMDVGLSEKGVKQAKAIGAFFQNRSFDVVVSSPLIRAVKTAEYILGGREQKIVVDERLSEQNFGIFEGFTYEQLLERYPDEFQSWNQDFSGYRIPGGESFSDVRDRIDNYLKELIGRDGTMLLVAHKGTLGHFLASSLGLPLEGYWNFVFEQGSYSCIDYEDGYAIIRKLNQSIS
ncbi:MAG: alpha-ribazole phosphatase [Anaerobutyricum sp.]|nr:alpha-ribazole phosphatase [Eubacterium sp.]MDY6047223.1 alpha-ribazole phosphatase [Anaerobutyricum sp.]